MKLYLSTLTLPGVKLLGENPLPRFCDPVQDRPLTHDGTFSPEDEILFGYQTGKKVLPYNMQDRFHRDRTPQTLKTIVLENEHLQAVFLPDFGARLYSLFNKKTGKDILYRNEMFQLGSLSQRGAWFSGGIEFNFGHYGHSTLTCEPLFAAAVQGPEGQFLRFYELERTTNAFYQMDFHLPDGAETLDLHVRLTGSPERDTPTYWWTNAALPQTQECRVFCGTSRVLLMLPRPDGSPDSVPCFAAGEMPRIKTYNGDASYPAAIDFSCEYFFQYEKEETSPWEAIGYRDNRLFFEASTNALRYRKMFCWGDLPGGRHWQRHLNCPGDTEYLELQAGIAPTQLHGFLIPAGEQVEFTQSFGECSLPETDCLTEDWETGCGQVEQAVRTHIPTQELYRRHKEYRSLADRNTDTLLHSGSGWGHLECLRLKRQGLSVPQSLYFPPSSVGEKERPWLALLETGVLPAHSPEELPRSWMTAEPWLPPLEQSLDRPGGRHWLSLLHYGVMLLEQGDWDGAEKVWKESLSLAPSAIAWRNLAQLRLRDGDPQAALGLMEKAVSLCGDTEQAEQAFLEEYMALLTTCGRHNQCLELFRQRKDDASDRMWISAAQSALELGELPWLDHVFRREFSTLAEGENLLSELWFRREALLTGEPLDSVKKTKNPPPEIDFRMHRE